MENKVFKTIKKFNLIENGDRLILGISGGPDSMSMLNILKNIRDDKKIDFEIIVAHINHLIRKEAKLDEDYVENYSRENKIKFYLKRIDVIEYANNNKIGLEEAGRKARYLFFEEVMKQTNANKIAIAHNKNDKIETMIMNILRGTGISGLKGIEPKRENIIRPLIECERIEIEKYCEIQELKPQIDKTNLENEYTRNKIRNIAIPYIQKEFNPNFIETANRLSLLAMETEEYIQKEMEKIYEKIKLSESENRIILDLKEFNKEDTFIEKRILLYTISKILGSNHNIEKVNIDDLIKLCHNNIGNKYLKPNNNIKVSINKGKIFFDALV